MPANLRFWRNVILIAVAHVIAVVGLARWSRETKPVAAQSIVWMSGNGAGYGSLPTATPKPVRVQTPEPKPEVKEEEPADDLPALVAAKSEIQLPAETPAPTPTPTATPTPRSTSTPRPTPSPKVKVPPKPTPKATPKPSPKPTPKPSPKKLVIAKASPKPKPTPEEKHEEQDVDLAKEEPVKPVEEKTPEATPAEKPKSVAASTGNAKTSSVGGGGRIGGSGGQSQFGWYGSMLHDRFYSEWVQPRSLGANAKASATVRLRIEKDGRISSFEIAKSSGNEAVDESIKAVAKRVTQVDALPAGLGGGEHYDVKINFELNSD